MKNEFTVLLVEDDLNDIFLVKRAFKIARIENPLQVVTDGLEAIQYLRGQGKYADRKEHPLPKLIVMDFKAVEHLFSSITHYWGLECAKPELEMAEGRAM